MTTPYLDEIERCNRVALMHKGQTVALGTPHKIKNSLNKKSVELFSSDVKNSYKLLKEKFEIEVQIFGDKLNIITDEPETDLNKIKTILSSKNIQLSSYHITKLSLENVFIHLINK